MWSFHITLDIIIIRFQNTANLIQTKIVRRNQNKIMASVWRTRNLRFNVPTTRIVARIYR